MNQLFTGSICLTDLIEKAKAGHSAFTKSAKNGKVYFNVKTWLNESPDKYGNIMSHQLNSTKEKKDVEETFYIGNSRLMDNSRPVAASDIDDSVLNSVHQKAASPEDAADDLPF